MEATTILTRGGALGVIYPSVRRAPGTNLACFRPALVGNVRRGDAWRLRWAGRPEPEVEKLRGVKAPGRPLQPPPRALGTVIRQQPRKTKCDAID